MLGTYHLTLLITTRINPLGNYKFYNYFDIIFVTIYLIMSRTIIDIEPLIGNTLDSRDEVIHLFDTLNSKYTEFRELVLDFTSVDFMSRSFADQFYKEQIKWTLRNDHLLSITNAPVQVIEILQAVSKTQMGKNGKVQDLPIYSFSKADQLSQYLQAI